MVKRIDHVGIAVLNLDSMIPILGEAFGLIPDEPVELPEQEVVVQFWRAGDTAIEVLAPLTDSSLINRFIGKRGQGLHHICVEVEDVQSELERLVHMNMKLVDTVPWMSPHGLAAYLHPQTGNGVSIELRQVI